MVEDSVRRSLVTVLFVSETYFFGGLHQLHFKLLRPHSIRGTWLFSRFGTQAVCGLHALPVKANAAKAKLEVSWWRWRNGLRHHM